MNNTSRIRCPGIVTLVVLALFAGANLSRGAESVRGLAAQLQPYVDSRAVAGAVTLVATADKILSLEAVGFADLDARKPMTTDALFWIASMSKPMTTAGLMMLVDEGRVQIDDPVEKYLPEFKDQWVVAEKDANHQLLKKPIHPITVKEVLTHTSGLTPRSPLEPEIDLLSLRDNVRSYPLLPLKFEPGTKYEYSNAGINTAGRIIEVVSGMPYEQFMDERLFKPLGMKDTTFWPNANQITRLAKSYQSNPAKNGLQEIRINQLTYPLTDRKRGPCPAGGLFSTALDVSTFCRMVIHGGTLDGRRYLSEAAVKQMTSTQTGEISINNNQVSGYGFGWATSRKGGETPFGHAGAYATDMNIDPKRQLITVYMVQYQGKPDDPGKKISSVFKKAAAEMYAK